MSSTSATEPLFLGLYTHEEWRNVMTRVVTLFCLLGGGLGLASAAADSGGPAKTIVPAVALVIGLVLVALMLAGKTLDVTASVVLGVFSIVMVASGAATEEGRGIVLLVGIGIYGSIFLPRIAAIAMVALACVAILPTEAFERGIDPTKVINLWFVIIVPALVVAWIRTRLTELAGLAHLARLEVEAHDRRRTAFLRSMSHELRTPLNAIIGFSDLLASGSAGPLVDKQREYVDHVREGGHHLLELVDDVLDLSTVERGDDALDVATFDVDAVVGDAVRIAAQIGAERGVEVSFIPAPAKRTVVGDARKVEQAVLNLLSNAVRFSPEDAAVDVIVEGEDGAVSISVRDEGPGIAPADLDRIFEEYGQSSADNRGGTGLGLPVTRRIARQHGGDVAVESELGAGSTFTLRIPEVPAAATTAEPRIDVAVGGQDTAASRRIMTIVAIVFFTLGGLVGLSNHVIDGTETYTLVNASVAVLAGMYLLTRRLRGRDLPNVAYHGFAALGVVLITIGNAPDDGPGIYLFILIAVAAPLFTTGKLMVLHAAVAIGGVAVTDAIERGFDPVQTMTIGGIVIATTTVLSWLVRSLTGLAQREHELRLQTQVAADHKSGFLAKTSHELRTPLNAIVGFSDVLAAEAFGPLNERQAAYVAHIGRAGRHQLALINDVLDVSKYDAGRMELDRSVGSLAELLVQAASAANRRASASGARVEVRSSTGFEIDGDFERLHGAFVGLFADRLALAPEAGVVDVELCHVDDRVQVMVVVEARREPVEDPTEELRWVSDEPGGRTGLELALARRAVERHGGSLSWSHRGAEEVVTVQLPARSEAPVEEVALA